MRGLLQILFCNSPLFACSPAAQNGADRHETKKNTSVIRFKLAFCCKKYEKEARITQD
jgi:hypothetical protein